MATRIIPLKAGQRCRCVFDISPAGSHEKAGAVCIGATHVPMQAVGDELIAPPMPPGLHLFEVRVDGVSVAYGYFEVAPSPLAAAGGEVTAIFTGDLSAPVARFSIELNQGPRGDSTYDIAVREGFEGTEAEWLDSLRAQAAELAVELVAEPMERAENARAAAQAAQSTAEEQAAIATKAAEDAQAPESIAAQAARPAAMVLVRDELMSILRDASLFDLDTDGQKIIVHTDRLADEQLAAVTDMLERFVPGFIEVGQYNHNLEVSWRDIGKYAECTTVQEMYLADASKNFFDEKLGYQVTDVCSDGSFVYPNKLKTTAAEGSNYASNLFSTAMQSHALFSGSFPEMTTWAGGGVGCTELILDAPMLKTFSEVYSNALKTIKCNSEEITSAAMLLWGKNIENVECVFPKLSSAKFTTNAKLNKESVLRIINSLPPFSTGTHVLQLGIHIDHQNDTDVLAAIDNAAANGWTVEKLWNGTATAATYSLRPSPSPPVYAKVHTYEDASGNTRQAPSWCHGVTSPDGREPEELGYMLFESVEAAREYFGV